MVDHRSERRGLAATRAAHHQDQAAAQHDEVLELLRHAEFVECGQFRGDVTQHHGDVAALVEYVDPETAQARLGDREIDLELARELLELLLVHELQRSLLHHLRRHLELVDGHDLAVDLDLCWRERREEQVRRLFLDHHFQNVVEIHGLALLCPRRPPSPA